ncbi:unnamed protein product [Mucor hiemalis]
MSLNVVEDLRCTESLSSTNAVTDNHSKKSILSVTKSIFFEDEPVKLELYTFGHITNVQIYEEKDHFGGISTKRIDGQPVKGRPLWLFNEAVKEYLRESDSAFRQHVQRKSNYINVVYVRKSPSKEPDETEEQLLNTMITRLKKRCFCDKAFSS